MAAFFIVYATAADAELIKSWINDEPDIAWIVRREQSGLVYHWQARHKLEDLAEQDYALWLTRSDPLTIPSGMASIPDTPISDPFEGWSQTLTYEGATAPWFGGNLPGPYHFHFRDAGKEKPNSLGRSGFSWDLDHYKLIGKPAHPDAKRWWHRLGRFLTKSAADVRWLDPSKRRFKTFVFPEALLAERGGRHLDINQ